MAYLSPPVYVDPYYRRPHYHRRPWGWYGAYGKNDDQNSAEFSDSDQIARQESELADESQLYQTGSELNQQEQQQNYQNARDEHPLAKGHSEFAKVHCDCCNGFTLLKDGETYELEHLKDCAEGKKLSQQLIGCHKKKKTHIHTKVKELCVPPPEECEEEEESSSSSDCSEEEEKKEVCEQPEGEVIEIYLDDCDKIANSIAKSYNENKPFRGTFNKKIQALDGSGIQNVKVSIATSAKNSKGVAALQFSMTPIENGKLVKDSTISETLWHLNLDNKKQNKRVVLQEKNVQVFKTANVPHEVLLATTSHVDAALSKLLSK